MAVGEIPSLKTQGKLWRIGLLYDQLSDYEIMRIQFNIFLNACFSIICCKGKISWLVPKPHTILQEGPMFGVMGKWFGKAWKNINNNFINQQIQDNIKQNVEGEC